MADLLNRHKLLVRKHTTRSSFRLDLMERIAFCFLSGSCILSGLEVVLALLHLALEERAILAVPCAMDVLRDYLELCQAAQDLNRF